MDGGAGSWMGYGTMISKYQINYGDRSTGKLRRGKVQDVHADHRTSVPNGGATGTERRRKRDWQAPQRGAFGQLLRETFAVEWKQPGAVLPFDQMQMNTALRQRTLAGAGANERPCSKNTLIKAMFSFCV
jgi:hypothetical protein